MTNPEVSSNNCTSGLPRARRLACSLLAAALGLAALDQAGATVIRTSQIVGLANGNLGTDSATGTTEGWNNPTAQVTLTNGSGSLNGTSLGLVASAGDRVFASATTALNARNQFAAGEYPTSSATLDTNLYFSFLYRFQSATDVSPDGEIMIRLNTQNSGTGSRQHWDLIARSAGGQMQVGITKAGATTTNYVAALINAGETFFVVVKHHIIPGAANDAYALWINPPLNSFGADESSLPPEGAAIAEGAEASGSGPGRFVVAAGLNSEFDELRIATTWAEVTPAAGSCGTAAIDIQPTNVTQSAEISATFSAAAAGSSTSPTYQWQRSTNNGVNWEPIAGATASSYTTPNLALADSGHQYRMIANVACNNSSATSAVASVTLTNPVVTPQGVVVNDTFLDTDLIGFDDRSNPPFSETNSLWYTATTDNLTAFGQGGNMLGTPLAGTSSLWLGYYTETNTPPVHLAVGRTLKVTLPFVPNSLNSFTNNATVRIGLFDYYDAGRRILADGANVGGSQGNATGVRGYMLALNFGPTFTDTTPLDIYARTVIEDVNLMGTTSDYALLGSGPSPGVATNVPAFQAGTEYTLEFSVARTAVNTVNITTTITGGGNNWSHTVTDTNFAYHRFDAFGIRPNSLETSADSFTFPFFRVEVLQGAVSVPSFGITSVQALSPNALKLTWASVSGATYHVLARNSLTGVETTNATIVATGSSTSYTNTPLTGTERYFRVVAPPYTP